MSDLTFEELTGTASVEEWTEQSSNEELASISGLAQQLLVVQKDIEEKKLELKELESQFRQISESSLPEALQSANLSEIVLSDGTKLSVAPFYKGHISEKNRPAALEWLMKNGHGALIKNEISLKFGRDEDERAQDTIASLQQRGLSPSVKQGVHAQTLNAFVKERLTNGKDIPSEIFGIYVGSRAKIERKR
tara:strand:+ start:1078 stop:1653 length:576 start_codon:yes stop_codon:yes gene_type:complete